METTTTQIEILKFEPCEEAVKFRSQYETFEQAWQNCPRGDWMLWIAKKLDVNLKTLTLAIVAYAARTKNQKQTADICREILTAEVLKLIVTA
jgi:hypothetical protein